MNLEIATQRLKRSSLLVMTYFLLKGYNILPKKELRWRLWVEGVLPKWYVRGM